MADSSALAWGGPEKPFDVFIVGGGVNGCGAARDAAGRGYSVILAEKDDLASGTSSKSTKLIHGGLRYLEYFQFGLVREALTEREILWALAPHLVAPLRFVLPAQKGGRPAWMLRLGLFLYDHIGGRKKLPPTAALDLRRDPAGQPLESGFSRGFEYSDCRVDDARLVVLNARDAADRGALILPRHEVMSAHAEEGCWRVRLRDGMSGAEREIFARLLVNAAGPWAESVLTKAAGRRADKNLRLVRGSHIVTRKIFDHDRAYIFQNDDGRVVFAIPYEDDFTLIGATDVDFAGAPQAVAITPEEVDYLCVAANRFFVKKIAPCDVVWSFSGLRPLFDQSGGPAQKASREHVIEMERLDGAPLITLFGGKLTSYRIVAEEILARAGEAIGRRGKPWTADEPLPGGEFAGGDLEQFIGDLRAKKPFLDAALARRLAKAYGTLCQDFLGAAQNIEDLGEDFGAGLTEAEVLYLIEREWARTPEDILWRRTKLGLRGGMISTEKLGAFLQRRSGATVEDPGSFS